jgi:hypothetical protein
MAKAIHQGGETECKCWLLKGVKNCGKKAMEKKLSGINGVVFRSIASS